MKIVSLVVFVSIFFVLNPDRSQASACRFSVAKIALGALSLSGLSGDLKAELIRRQPISIKSDDFWRTEQPYQNRMGFVGTFHASGSSSYHSYAQEQMNLFADFYFNLSSREKNDPGYFASDLFYERFQVGSSGRVEKSEWAQVSGDWRSFTLNRDTNELPFYGFGSHVIYDETPHTPGLYQFWVVDFSGWPFFVTHKHYAWITTESFTEFRPEDLTSQSPRFATHFVSIPTPGALVPFTLSLGALKRRR